MKDARKTSEPNIKRKPGKTSPYVIHLSHDEPIERTPSSSPNLDLLAKQLVENIEENNFNEEDDLLVNFDDIAHQLQEQDYHNTIPDLTPEFTATTPEEQLIEQPILEQVTTVPREQLNENFIEHIEEKEPLHVSLFTKVSSLEFPTISNEHFGGMRIKAIASFVALSFAFVLPLHAIQQVQASRSIQNEILASGTTAIDHFLRGASALENEQFNIAEIDFAHAQEDFAQAEASLHDFNIALSTLAQILPQTDNSYDSAKGLITAGKELSTAATILANAAEDIHEKEALTATTKLALLNTYISSALPHVNTATEALEHVDPRTVPLEYQETVVELKEKGPALATSLNEFHTFADALITIMGGERKMRYLLVFQNNTELRATGGFPGSFAEIDVMNGEITDIHIPPGGTYDVQGQLSAFVEAPKPLSLINPRWEFHDANWFPDFPTSAKKTLWFYEKAGGPTMDGVIAINATLMPKLLEVTGPIDMPEYGRTIDAENFLFETQKIVEFEYENYTDEEATRSEDAPKQFIGDLAPKVLEKLTDADMSMTLSMLDVLGEGLQQKDVLLYLEDNALQSDLATLGWTGELQATEGDYLMVVNTNIGGGKTDTIINQDIDVYSEVQLDGSIINTVTVTKEHKGLNTALFEGVNNVDYIRLYTPKGSELISATGFEIPPAELFETSDVPLTLDEDLLLLESEHDTHPSSQTDIWNENGKTVFGNWIQTKPGEIEQVTFTYRLPIALTTTNQETTLFAKIKERLGFRELESHTILVQKQPGVETRQTSITLVTPEQKTFVWSSHKGEASGVNIEINNEQDQLLRFLLQNE